MNSKVSSKSSIILSTLLVVTCLSKSLLLIQAQFLPDFSPSANSNNDNNNLNLKPQQQTYSPAAFDYYIQNGAGNGPASEWKFPYISGAESPLIQQQLLEAIDNSITQGNSVPFPTTSLDATYYDLPLSRDLSSFNYVTTTTNNNEQPAVAFETNRLENQASLLEYLNELEHLNDNSNVVQPRAAINSLSILNDEDKLALTADHPIADDLINDESGYSMPTRIDKGISGPINIPIDLAVDQEVEDKNTDNNNNNNYYYNSNKTEPLDALLTVYMSKVLDKLHDNRIKQQSAIKTNNNDHLGLNRYDIFIDDNDQSIDLNQDDDSEQDRQRSTSRYGNGEYIDHPLALIGHQYVQGGAGEGRQLLGPEGTFENVQVIKTDRAVPSYCDPPNPCPIGYTAEDGCIEKFVNSASFSREYQAKQRCSCDNEHSLFNCAAPSLKNQENDITSMNTLLGGGGVDYNQHTSLLNQKLTTPDNSINDIHVNDEEKDNISKLDTLARTIQNRFGSLASVRNLINGGNGSFEKKQQKLEQDSSEDNSARVHKRT